MTSFFIGSYNYIKENDDIKNDTRKNVKSVKSSNEEKEICKDGISIFIYF
jgi:hypothetical protein